MMICADRGRDAEGKMMNVPPVKPFFPDAPLPGVSIPEIPDVMNITPPEPVAPVEMLNEEHDIQNKENAEQLDSKLKEVEEE